MSPFDSSDASENWPDRAGESDGVLNEFNQAYMVVNEAGRARVYQKVEDGMLSRSWYQSISFEDLKRLYLNRTLSLGRGPGGEDRRVNAAAYWLKHPGRRQYIKGIKFDPSRTGAEDGWLNLWNGLAIEPKRGDWSLLRDHMLNVICAGNTEHFDYLFGWCARVVQFPAEQGEVAVVLRGGEGSGKGTLAYPLMRILGQHAIKVAQTKHLVGNFNAHLRDAVFLFADEAFFAGDKKNEGALKNLITEEVIAIESKYQNAIMAPNYLHILMASNEAWVVPASIEARRFFVLDVAPDRIGDHAYFKAIRDQLGSGGLEAFLHDLLNHPLGKFNFRAVPATAGLQDQKLRSLNTHTAWWRACLERGYVFETQLGLHNYFAEWHPFEATALLYASYEQFAKKHGERHPLTLEQLGTFMVTMKAVKHRERGAVLGEAMADEPNPYGGSTRKAALVKSPVGRTASAKPGYKLGTLEEARAHFTSVTGLPFQDEATE